MPRKRTADESNSDEQTNEGPESSYQQEEDNVKREKLDSLHETKLQDLPIELLEAILANLVAIEVKDLKLARSAWEEKADLVISRLRCVCSQWSYILTTSCFRKELKRTLDKMASRTIRLEVLSETPLRSAIVGVTTLKDDVILSSTSTYQVGQYRTDYVIEVYNRNNMQEVTDTIQMPGLFDAAMVSCSASDCVYVVLETQGSLDLSVARISKDADQRFTMSPWINDRRQSVFSAFVSASGDILLIPNRPETPQKTRHLGGRVGVYNANGCFQHEVRLPPYADITYAYDVLQKSNGNLVLGHDSDQNKYKMNLLEIDKGGSIVRQYESSCLGDSSVNFADLYGRIMITDPEGKRIELLDAEFNLLGVYSWQQPTGNKFVHHDLHYDSERNEIVRVYHDFSTDTRVLAKLRFTDE